MKFDPEENKIIFLGDQLYLMWMEPEYLYIDDKNDQRGFHTENIPFETPAWGEGFKLYPLRSRYNGTDPVKIPLAIRERIIKYASEDYPILIIDGYWIEGGLDKYNLSDKDVFSVHKAWGEWPRKMTGGDPECNSVAEFKKDTGKGKF